MAHALQQQALAQQTDAGTQGAVGLGGGAAGTGATSAGGGDETASGGADLSTATMDEDSRSSEASSRLSASAELQNALAIRKRKLSEDDTLTGVDGPPAHIEEEHVQKLLEKQLQQSGAYGKSGPGNSNGVGGRELAALAASVFQAAGVPAERREAAPAGEFGKSFQFPQMPALVPISQADGKQLQQMVPLSVFSNPMAQFLFPGLPPVTPPASAAERAERAAGGQGGSLPPSTPGGMRIFNPEAYCELCNKEFCNKYFLKTHKANKHGIYSVESL
ncbi:hypothetical protein BIW11_04702, partial [Tropilaelaps mercedesae]